MIGSLSRVVCARYASKIAAQTILTRGYGTPPDYDPREDKRPITIKTDHLSKEDCATMLRILRSGVLKYADGGREPVSTQETEGTAEMSSSNG
jgi:hypothetical protein